MLGAFCNATRDRNPDFVHIEAFAPISGGTTGAFNVLLTRSGERIRVEVEQSILEALEQAGRDVPFSCRQGVCGVCETAVISGPIDHRDHVLSDDERKAGKTMMICCSRSLDRADLALDL
ncbi:MAG: 2Fe-2S iron-sulfur cluster-binding protein [Hyphomicrobiaceae bacterium]